MDTEQQQQFHSEKQTTKQHRKSIPFTDLSIKNWKPKNDKDKIGFPRPCTITSIRLGGTLLSNPYC